MTESLQIASAPGVDITSDESTDHVQKSLSQRELVAVIVFAGMLAGREVHPDKSVAVKEAVDYADALLNALRA